MKLTCPNCSAQYEVDTRVIPADGRDVQCSSCGHTWFQDHPDAMGQGTETVLVEAPVRREPDPEAMRILREEAERERAARTAERSPLETQPEMGMPAPPRNGGAKAAHGPEPTAIIHPVPSPDPEPSDDERAQRPAPRRALLPDIEELSSTLEADDQIGAVDPTPVATAHRRAREGRGKRLGFGIAVAVFALLTLLYTQGPRIAVAVPAFAPVMRGYVDVVDRGRLWLDGALRAAVSQPEGEEGVAEAGSEG